MNLAEGLLSTIFEFALSKQSFVKSSTIKSTLMFEKQIDFSG